jgi:hypothetical protein
MGMGGHSGIHHNSQLKPGLKIGLIRALSTLLPQPERPAL